MAKPLVYPADRHRRHVTPKQYQRYQTYKPYLRDEFAKQCVYCRKPDGTVGADNFGVDHYRPKDRFPELVVAYDNLFYACNSHKGNYWPSADERLRAAYSFQIHAITRWGARSL